MHEPPAATADIAVLPGVLGSRTLRRTDKYASGPSPCGCPVARPSPRSRDGVSCIMRARSQVSSCPGKARSGNILKDRQARFAVCGPLHPPPPPTGGLLPQQGYPFKSHCGPRGPGSFLRNGSPLHDADCQARRGDLPRRIWSHLLIPGRRKTFPNTVPSLCCGPEHHDPRLSDLQLPPTHSGGHKARPYDRPAHPLGRGGVNPRPQRADVAPTP